MYGKIVSIIIILIALISFTSAVYASSENEPIIPSIDEYIADNIKENDKISGFTFEHWFLHFSETAMAIIIMIINPILIILNFIFVLVSFKKMSKRKWIYIFNPIISILLILVARILSNGITVSNAMIGIYIMSIIIFIIQIVILINMIIEKNIRKNELENKQL